MRCAILCVTLCVTLCVALHFQSSAGVGVLNGKLYVVGGYNGQTAEKTCEVYDPQTEKWSLIAPLNVG